MSTDKLRELALAATEGPWASQGLYIYTGYPDASGVLDADIIGKTEHPMKTGRKDAAYIAAANPVAILERLDALKEAKRGRDLCHRIAGCDQFNCCLDGCECPESILDKL